MPIERHYLADHGFVLTRLHGSLDDGALREHVRLLTLETRDFADLRELADCSALTDVQGLTGKGILEAARLEEGRGANVRGRLAIVAPDSLVYGLARMYQAISEQFRAEVSVFRSWDEAAEWLGVTELSDEIRALGGGS